MGTDELNIFEEEFWKINQVLEKLLTETNARAVLLIDRAGQLITSVGDTSTLDVPSFATLSAADFAATAQLALLIGENAFSTLFHQGENQSIYISIVADKLILAIVFDKRTTLGLVRIKANQVSKELDGIFKTIFTRIKSTYEKTIDSDFLSEAESELDNLFK
ncbi:roadblock/LC7 domain-containing protein [bacterium]|uniref:Roadblock/LC7 domain-containing protein n=1 Tax=candidate division WOR-3 bacterium TaxID=2052148 RepID=A0A7C0ZJ48_UNCW3|nr:MAG: roadblock/LC7 domain-containing protein [bacterium]RKZ21214.1 MAG: roadblock/LC7 domain-containing protein [bacterium]HDI83685.1 roadblock/LC7 domain-containing protein [candidate division WOR-3 bacterium]